MSCTNSPLRWGTPYAWDHYVHGFAVGELRERQRRAMQKRDWQKLLDRLGVFPNVPDIADSEFKLKSVTCVALARHQLSMVVAYLWICETWLQITFQTISARVWGRNL